MLTCEDNLTFMGKLPDASIKLVVTSPPYNVGKSYERRTSLESYLQSQREVIAECVRLLHPAGSLCWQVGNFVDRGEIVPLDAVLYPIFKEHGLKLRNRIVWHFGHGLHCKKRLSGRYETINWFTKCDSYTFNLDPIRVPSKYPGKRHFKGPNAGKLSGNPKGKNPGDVWMFPNVKSNHVEKTIHPCQFPVELVERLVLSLTNPMDSVLESLCGSWRHGRSGSNAWPQGLRLRHRGGVCASRQGAGERAAPRYDQDETHGQGDLRPNQTQRRPLMRIVERYSHLNGEEYLLVHRPSLWQEVLDVIDSVDAEACKDKVSKEKSRQGQMLYSPGSMNGAIATGFKARGWRDRRQSFFVTSDGSMPHDGLCYVGRPFRLE